MYNTISLDMLQSRPKLTKKQKYLVYGVLFAIISIMIIFLYTQHAQAISGNRSFETYNHLVDGTFYYEDSNSTAAKRFQAIAASILRVVFPFMTVFGLTVILIKLSSTVIYLSTPDFFDEVHYHHYQRRQKKYAGNSRGAMRAFLESMKENGLGDSVIKGLIIPDVKALAFYDACEIGEDGRPSMSTFFKNSFPKYIAIIALIIMINDQTMLTLYFRGAEVGVYFFQKATQVDYVGSIERFMNMGRNYDPGWKGAKKNVYKTIERELLAIDKTQGTEKTEYKQLVGRKIADWMEANMGNIDWENYRVTCVAGVDSLPYSQGKIPANTYQAETVSAFGVKSPDQAPKYLTVRINLENKNFWKPEAGEVKTSDPNAWAGTSANQLVLDTTKVSGSMPGGTSIRVVRQVAATPGSVSPCKVSGTTITCPISQPDKFEHMYIGFVQEDGKGGRTQLEAIYKKPVTAQK